MPLPMPHRLSRRNRGPAIGAFIDRIGCQAGESQLLQGIPLGRTSGHLAVPRRSCLTPHAPQGSMRKAAVVIPELHATTRADFKRWPSPFVRSWAREVVIPADRTVVAVLLPEHPSRLFPQVPGFSCDSWESLSAVSAAA